MKHATEPALDRLEPLLGRVRRHDELKERARGKFYQKGRAVLHFHEDPTGLFADLHLSEGWIRLPVSTGREQAAMLRALAGVLSA